MLNVRVNITGDKEEIAALKTLGDKLTDFTIPLKEIGSELKTYYSKTVFGSEGGELGQPWKELSPSYKEWKKKHYGTNRGILIATGTMQKSFRAVSSKTMLTVDNTDPKFMWHQEGTGVGTTGASITRILGSLGRAYSIGGMGRGRSLPARPMLAVTTNAMDIIGRIIKTDITKKVATANGR